MTLDTNELREKAEAANNPNEPGFILRFKDGCSAEYRETAISLLDGLPATVLSLLDRLDAAERDSAAARTNFHTMQGAANVLRINLEVVKSALNDVLSANGDYLKANPHGNVEPDPVTLACRRARTALSHIKETRG